MQADSGLMHPEQHLRQHRFYSRLIAIMADTEFLGAFNLAGGITCRLDVLAKTKAASREFMRGSGKVLVPPQVRKNTAGRKSGEFDAAAIGLNARIQYSLNAAGNLFSIQ